MCLLLDGLNRTVAILIAFSRKMLDLSTAWELSYYFVLF